MVLKILNLVLRWMTWEEHTLLNMLKTTLAKFILTLMSLSEPRQC